MKSFRLILFSIIPLVPNQWLNLNYSKITPNQVNLKNKQMIIKVDKSANPIFHIFKKPKKIKELKLKGRLDISFPLSTLHLKDDFALRVGLITEGDHQLGFWAKMVASDWLKTLFKLAEERGAKGIGQIYFYALTDRKADLGISFDKEYSGINFKTIWFSYLKEDKSFEFNINAPQERILGVWINSDGDGSQTSFKIELNNIEIKE